MLNLTLPGDPIAPLLSTFDDAVPADFPPLSIGPELKIPPLFTDIPSTSRWRRSPPRSSSSTCADTTHWVEFDLTGAGADLRVDAVVNVKGTWSGGEPTASASASAATTPPTTSPTSTW